jgi:hypothetical protein
MNIPDSNHPVWTALIKGEMRMEFQSLATKIIIGRLISRYEFNPTNEVLASAINELIAFFKRNQGLALTQNDLQKIFKI